MPTTDDVPGSVRVRCGESNAYRFRAIERASELYGVNRSDTVACACNDVVELVEAIADILEREDLTLEQRRERAERLDRRTRLNVVFEEPIVSIESD